jgi:hypothetical protein
VQLSRRKLMQVTGVTGAALVLPGALGFAPALRSSPVTSRRLVLDAPTTGFEETGTWTTHEAEVALLEQIAADPDANTMTLTVVGLTAQERPLHQVVFGLGATQNGTPKTMPTTMVLGSQHGNEPAGRDASLKLIRDLAYADLEDPSNADLKRLLQEQTIVVVPSANPDGREAGSRANSRGFDINRDHLRLETEEARTFADVILEWAPFMALDLHEYGPSAPVAYDDDLLYLWSRNLNVDEAVRTMAEEYCVQYIKKDGEAAGYTADEYGLYKVGPNVAQVPVGGTTNDFSVQLAGGGDEGICRNAMGLRHTLGILVESRVTLNPQQSPDEAIPDFEGGSLYGDSAAARARRVASQRVVLESMLRFQTEQGEAAADVCNGASVRKAKEGANKSAPVFFSGQDDSRPLQSDSEVAADPMSGYQLPPEVLADPKVARAIAGQGITVENGFVSMGQAAEPMIPLLFDKRGRSDRRVAALDPLD